jgi:hypothetical protein
MLNIRQELEGEAIVESLISMRVRKGVYDFKTKKMTPFYDARNGPQFSLRAMHYDPKGCSGRAGRR